jgi:hypothetical protein
MSALREIIACATVDAAFDTLEIRGQLEKTAELLAKRIEGTIKRRVPSIETGFVCFRQKPGMFKTLAQSANAPMLMSAAAK